MANLINLVLQNAPTVPTSLWPKIYFWIESFIGNYGWTIFIFTLLVKLVMSPIDFFNKYTTRKNGFIQKRLSGQVAKINQKYANNKEEANKQVTALYKKEGYNMMGSCVFTLVTLVLSLTVFISFFNSLKTISSYKMLDQYYVLEQTYNQTEGTLEQKQQAVELKYAQTSDNSQWLWVKNIWRNDSNVSSVPTYAELSKAIKNNGKDYNGYLEQISEEQYNNVMGSLITKYNNWNGYYIMAVLAGGLAFLSQYLTELLNKSKKEKQQQTPDPTAASMKIMKFMMPAIMVIFALSSTASFGIYIIANSVISIILSLLFDIFVKKLTKKEEEKYNAYLEQQALHMIKQKSKEKPKMVNYKKLGDRL